MLGRVQAMLRTIHISQQANQMWWIPWLMAKTKASMLCPLCWMVRSGMMPPLTFLPQANEVPAASAVKEKPEPLRESQVPGSEVKEMPDPPKESLVLPKEEALKETLEMPDPPKDIPPVKDENTEMPTSSAEIPVMPKEEPPKEPTEEVRLEELNEEPPKEESTEELKEERG